MIRKIGFILLVFSSLAFITPQSEIDYAHKSLKKELHKVGISEMSAILEIPLETEGASIDGKFFKVHNSTSSLIHYIYVGRVISCRGGGCSDPKDRISSNEYFDYYILFDQAKAIYSVKVFNYQASHGYEITTKGWLKQFIGYRGKAALEVNKDIDAISGATVSVYAITKDINEKSRLINAL